LPIWAVGGEDAAGGDLVHVAEGAAVLAAEGAVGLEAEIAGVEEAVVLRLDVEDGVAAEGEDALADREPLVVGAARRVLEVRDLALVVHPGLVHRGGNRGADDEQGAMHLTEYARHRSSLRRRGRRASPGRDRDRPRRGRRPARGPACRRRARRSLAPSRGSDPRPSGRAGRGPW